MELNKNLHNLIQRAWHLQDRINERIHHQSVSFCKHCFEHHGLFCGISETTEEAEERRRLIPIRDSLKDIQDMLLFLQTKESMKKQQEDEAFARLETSRLQLLERIKQHPGQGKGRKVDVLEELNDWFGEGETAFTWKFKQGKEKNVAKKGRNGIFSSAVRCIWSLFHPRNWFETAQMAMILAVLYTGISSAIDVYNRSFKKQNLVLLKDAKLQGKLKDDNWTEQIGVLRGRG